MKVFRFDYSPYCLKVEKALDLLGLNYEKVPVPYLDRRELAQLTGGYIQVPVLVDESGKAHTDSRAICQLLAARSDGEKLVPPGLEGVTWAYHDWCDEILEEVMFRIAAPLVHRRFEKLEERSFYVFIKERKYGKNCVQTWEKEALELTTRARTLLAPTEKTLAARPFVLGSRPTLADAALYGQFAMLRQAGVDIAETFGATFARWLTEMQG